VVLAALGQRECESGGVERVSDEARRAARRQAAWVIVQSVLIAVVLTAISWFI
jgi:hypothetical protein